MPINLKAMMQSFRDRRQIQQQAEQVLTQYAGGSVSLRFSGFIRTPSICRLQVKASPIELGERLIMKGIRYFDDRTGVETRYPAPQWMFLNDWAGLQFLQQEIESPQLSPRLYVAAHQPALLLMEDLKPFAHLGTFLQGRDGSRASSSLLQWGAGLGKLHAQTIGKRPAYDLLRDALAPRAPSWGWVPPWQRASAIYDGLLSGIPALVREQGFGSYEWMRLALRQTCEELSLPCGTQVEAELALVQQALRSPGPFLAYTHGDPCSENCLFDEQGLKFVDFENGAYRHALLDAVYPRMSFPTCWNGQQIPLVVVKQIEQRYRSALVTGCSEAASDQLFGEALVHACTYWAVLPCQFHAVRRLTTGDPSFCPPSLQMTMQQRLLFRCERLAQTIAETGYLESLGNLFQRIRTVLRKRWPEKTHQLPFYPAFKDFDSAPLLRQARS